MVENGTIKSLNGSSKRTHLEEDRELLRRRDSVFLSPGGGRRVRVADLFCGCGGMTLGAALAARQLGYGVEVRLAVDKDSDVLDIYRDNLSCLLPLESKSQQTRRIAADDVGRLFSGRRREPNRTEAQVKALAGPVDIMFGGPPCQGNSDLNNHTRRTDSRNDLYLRMARAAHVLRPKVLIIENVPPVVHDQNDVVSAAKRSLERSGYQVSGDVLLRMDQLGVPQKRKRHVLIASRLKVVDVGAIADELTDVCSRQQAPRAVGWAIGGLREAGSRSSGFDRTGSTSPANQRRIDVLFDRDLHHLPNKHRPPCHSAGGHSYLSVYGRMHWNEPAQTITTGFGSMGQGCYVHPRRRRTITPHEAARLQTFPDFFSFESTQKRTVWARAIGNAVPPLAMRAVVETVLKRVPV